MSDTESDIPRLEEIDTSNEYYISKGENLSNHSTTLLGLGRFVRQSINVMPTFRTKQEAYRYAAWIVLLADNHLPDVEEQETHTFERVLDAIRRV